MRRGLLYTSILCLWHNCCGILEECQISDAVNKFSVDIFKSVAKNYEGNVAVSPVGVSVLLSILEQAASGVTEKELEHVLHLNKLGSKEAYSGLVYSLKKVQNNSSVIFELANGIFIDKSFEVESDFKNVLVKDYLSSIEAVTFGSGNDIKTINSWTAKHTHGRVQNLLEDALSPNTAAVLINAIYFKGLWLKPFDEKHTFNGPFSPKQLEKVSVPFMHQKFHTIYGEDSKLKISWIHLPFSDGKFSMILVLPNMRFGLNDVLASITAADIANIISSKNTEEVYVTIPKFKLTSNLNLVPVLKEIGLSEIFTDSAHLDGISSFSRNLKISDVIQKAEIEVDEKGATAVTVTYAVAIPTSAISDENQPIIFNADHPFLVLVADTTYRVPVFISRIQKPET